MEEPSSRLGRSCIGSSRVFTSAVSWLMLRLASLASDRLRCDHTGSTGLSSCASDHVDEWFDGLTDTFVSPDLADTPLDPEAAIRQAQARDKVMRNVAKLVITPKGQAGWRPSRVLTLDQAAAVLEAARTRSL